MRLKRAGSEEEEDHYPVLVGVVGDTPINTQLTRTASHTALRCCSRCFIYGITKDAQKRRLGGVNCVGYAAHPELNSFAYPFNEQGQWYAQRVHFSVGDVGVETFDREMAAAISVTEQQHWMRALEAERIVEEARTAYPLPPFPPHGEAPDGLFTQRMLQLLL